MADQPALDDPMPLDDVNFFDPAINDCPYHAYRTLRDDAPVWFDERLKAFVVTRHDDVLAVLRDTERFNNAQRRGSRPQVQALYEEKGWVPARTLAGPRRPEPPGDAPALRPRVPPEEARARSNRRSKVSPIELIDEFIDAGQCDWVQQFAVPLAAGRHRHADGRRPERHLADQGVDRCVGATARTDADAGGGDLVDRDGDRGPALLPADLRTAPRAARRHPAVRPRQHADPRVGALPHRRGTPRRDDGRHLRRRLGDDHQRPVRWCAAADRAPRPVGPTHRRPRPVPTRPRRGGAPSRSPGAAPDAFSRRRRRAPRRDDSRQARWCSSATRPPTATSG